MYFVSWIYNPHVINWKKLTIEQVSTDMSGNPNKNGIIQWMSSSVIKFNQKTTHNQTQPDQ